MSFIRRGVVVLGCAALTGAALLGYRTIDAQTAWAALWSLCAAPR